MEAEEAEVAEAGEAVRLAVLQRWAAVGEAYKRELAAARRLRSCSEACALRPLTAEPLADARLPFSL